MSANMATVTAVKRLPNGSHSVSFLFGKHALSDTVPFGIRCPKVGESIHVNGQGSIIRGLL